MYNENIKIAVFGLGHMGLPTAALFAQQGLQVLGVDINKENVKLVNSGRSPIMEPGLGDLVRETVASGNLSATDNGKEAAYDADVMMVIVPTPVDLDKRSDLKAVQTACKTISSSLNEGDLVIIESTVPPGTCENLVIPLLEESGLKAGKDFGLAFTPERALPNNTIHEITHNARVIGGINQESADNAAEIYGKITAGKIIKVKNLMTAEMVKLMENTYRDTNIALANEMAIICESLDIDAIEAIEAANHHPRVNIHTPGPGVGGHCLSIDPYFIVEAAQKRGIEANLIKTSRMINEEMPEHVVHLVREALSEVQKPVKGSKVGILGVAYKANVADARETPAENLIKLLIKEEAQVCAHDPFVSPNVIKSFKVKPVSLDQALKCDCVVLVTDHDLYKDITPHMIEKGVLVCTRPVLNPDNFRAEGVIFKGVGRF